MGKFLLGRMNPDEVDALVNRITAGLKAEISALEAKLEVTSQGVQNRFADLEKTLGASTFVARVCSSPVPGSSQQQHPSGGEGSHSSDATPTAGQNSVDAGHPGTMRADGGPIDPIQDVIQHRYLAPGRACEPQPYDGKEGWSEYKRQFGIIASRNGWSSDECSDVLTSKLRGEALVVLGSFPPNGRIQFGELCGALEQRFGVDPATSLSQFRLRTQRPKESMQDFSLALQRLAYGALSDCPVDVLERLMVAQFIDGLRNTNVQIMVQMSNPPGLREAVKVALEIEARLGQSRSQSLLLVSSHPTSTPLDSLGSSGRGTSPQNTRRNRNRNRGRALASSSGPAGPVTPPVTPLSGNAGPSVEGGSH